MKFVTRRLVIRDITQKDAPAIVLQANNLKVTRNPCIVPYPYTVKDAQRFIRNCIKQARAKNRKSYEFAVEIKKSKEVAGLIGITDLNSFSQTASIGYLLGEKHWRKGIMSEALEAMIKFAFRRLNLKRLQAEVFFENKASVELLKKFAFKKEGLRRQAVRAKSTGKWHDVWIYGLLKSDIKR